MTFKVLLNMIIRFLDIYLINVICCHWFLFEISPDLFELVLAVIKKDKVLTILIMWLVGWH